MSTKPEITQIGLLAMQVCVPKEFTDAEAEQFANAENPTGCNSNWGVRHEAPVRVDCEEREGCVHLVLTC